MNFAYEPAEAPDVPELRRAYWNAATGLQQVDGLTPTPYLYEAAEDHIEGRRTLEQVGEDLRRYHGAGQHAAAGEGRQAASESGPALTADMADAREADLVSQRIVEVLSRGAFSLEPSMPATIHRLLFQDLDERLYRPGRYKEEPLVKQEAILNGDSVLYADPSLVEQSLRYLFEQERERCYSAVFMLEERQAFARFAAHLWQVHPFCEGNTRTVAVFLALYLRDLGFDVDNSPFADHAQLFRDALVRANYRNAKASIMPDLSYLVAFFENVLGLAANDLDAMDLRCQALFDDPSLLRNISPARALVS